MTILDTLIGQAKGTLSRAYLISGIVPAASMLFAWRVYDAHLAGVRVDLENLVHDTKSLSSGTLFGVIVLAVTGGILYAGRSLILRVLQDLPGPVLGSTRDYLVQRQVDRWWAARRRQYDDEQRLTLLTYAKAKQFDKDDYDKVSGREHVKRAVAMSAGARAHLERIAPEVAADRRRLEAHDIDRVVQGLAAFYSLAPVGSEDPRPQERDAWTRVCSAPDVVDALAKMYAQMYRELAAATAASREQPDDERWIAPTRLGNRVAALDDYAERRYGISTSTLWIRLWGVLDDKDKHEVVDAQLTVETLSNLTAAFGILAVFIAVRSLAAAVPALAGGQRVVPDWRAIAFASGLIALAAASYNAAVFAFGSVAERITRLVDLYRLRLIAAVGYAPPKTIAEERAALDELNKFFAVAADRDPSRVLALPAARARAAGEGRLLGRITL